MEKEEKPWKQYFPEKERNAIEEIEITEYQSESTAVGILRRLNLKQANSIKGFGGRK